MTPPERYGDGWLPPFHPEPGNDAARDPANGVEAAERALSDEDVEAMVEHARAAAVDTLTDQVASILYRLRDTHPNLDTQGLDESDCVEIAQLVVRVGLGLGD